MTALTVFIACLAAAASTSAGTERKAALRLVDRDPLTVTGNGFRSRERVRVVATLMEATADEPESTRRVVRASTTGSFRVVFSEITVDRCNSVRVVAIRSSGGEVVVKMLPSPMCAPMGAP
jgi:hypothetical protein